ncbi:DUF5327 family protein [Aciduricibacillus chroicocephali]|uniref:DUF5327 family protein n=1 Tax=Aciduricibacillus chroicocephali TaxID=3054939 RepID=A0ABY9KU32_9BACI|nr:DUF5327 family protein [Bacillaceae bacterium 44XB]
MSVSTDKILDKMIQEITEARKAGKPEDIQKHASRIQLLCELLLDDQGDQKQVEAEMHNIQRSEPSGIMPSKDTGGSLLDF